MSNTKRRGSPPKMTTLEERLATTGHDGIWFLRRCETCTKVLDREELFEYPFDCECLLCKCKRERIREGMHRPHASPNEQRAVSRKIAHARRKVELAAAMRQLLAWSAARRVELEANPEAKWNVYGVLLQEAPAVRERLGLPPSESPHAI